MVAYLKRMPAGVPGDVTRPTSSMTIEPIKLDSTTGTPTAFGVPLKIVGGLARQMGAGDAATAFYGMLVRPYPTMGGAVGNELLGAGTPSSTFPADALRRGYMSVLLSTGGGTAAKGGVVYMRVAAAAGGKPLGGIEAVADSTNTIALPATFMGPADANFITEIAVNI